MRRSLGLLLLLLLLPAGCTTGRGGETASSSSATLRIAQQSDIKSLDPAKVPDLFTSELLMQCFEGLARIDAKNQVEPVLAEKWDISPDGKTYAFHLRTDVTFHNGRPFVADDVKYSWERALAPKTASTVAANYLNGVLGVQEVVDGKRSDLSGVEVVDAHTLKVTIDRPRSFFLEMLTYPSNFIVCKEAVEKNGGVLDQKAFIGTGPFMLESYTPGSQINLKANPHYWGGKPAMARIEMPIMIQPETIYNNFQTNRLDMWNGPLPTTRYAQDKAAGKFTKEYHLLPNAAVDYLVMHPGLQPAFAKKEVRQAFALAIDRNQILKVAYNGVGRVADGMLPPELPDAGAGPPPVPYDPAKARQLLALSGYPGGKGFPTLTLITLEQTPTWQAACEIIRANLRDNLGITVEMESREAGQYWDDTAHETVAFYLTGWVADYPDAQDFLSTLFVSNAPLNHVKYHNPHFDDLCNRADAKKDPPQRTALYAQANRQLMDDVAVLPIAFPPRIALIHQDITGWSANLCSLLPHTRTTRTKP